MSVFTTGCLKYKIRGKIYICVAFLRTVKVQARVQVLECSTQPLLVVKCDLGCVVTRRQACEPPYSGGSGLNKSAALEKQQPFLLALGSLVTRHCTSVKCKQNAKIWAMM